MEDVEVGLFTVQRRVVHFGKGRRLGARVGVRERSEVRGLSVGEETARGSLCVRVADVLDGSDDAARCISSGARSFVSKLPI